MLLSADELVECFARVREEAPEPRVPVDVVVSHEAFVRARDEAARLSGEVEEDEAAALFFAIARQSRRFAPVGQAVCVYATRLQAFVGGHRIEANPLVLDMLRAGVLRGELGYAYARDWFAGRLRTLP